jgi:hypothetical protein
LQVSSFVFHTPSAAFAYYNATYVFFFFS